MAELTRDSSAVRVRLAAASAIPGDTTIRVECAAEPLHMTNPTVGIGPLGGMSVEPEPEGERAVVAQRRLIVDGAPVTAELRALGGGRYRLTEPGGSSRVVLEPERPGPAGSRSREVLVDGFRFEVETLDERLAALREKASRGRAAGGHAGPLQVKAIIPGKVVAVSVAPGDAVTAGQQLLVVEAMKMQNELRAPRDGTIERVGVAVGVNIEIGDLLVVIS